jgi:hypothetical protein
MATGPGIVGSGVGVDGVGLNVLVGVGVSVLVGVGVSVLVGAGVNVGCTGINVGGAVVAICCTGLAVGGTGIAVGATVVAFLPQAARIAMNKGITTQKTILRNMVHLLFLS